MALQFYIGGSGAGKTTAMMKEMIRQSMERPERRFFVIVPEQATMEMQRKLVSLHPRKCILNLEVTSLNRLAYRVFDEVGAQNGAFLEEIGKTFLIEKIALEKKKELPYLGGCLAKPAYLAEMKSLLSELMLYGVTPEALEKATGIRPEETNDTERGKRGGETDRPDAADRPDTGAWTGAGDGRKAAGEEERISAGTDHAAPVSGARFRLKMADVVTVYRAFLTKLAGTYMTAEEVPDRFCRVADRSRLLRGSVIALDGFTGFTPVQLRLLERLMPVAENVYVALTADPEQGITGPWHRSDLFALSRETADALRRVAGRAGVPVREPVVCRQGPASRHAGSPELSYLERYLFRGLKPRTDPPRPHDIVFAGAKSPREETEAAAREICRLVREEGFRYRDIAVVTGDLTSYGICAAEAFSEAEIPYFIDEKRSLLRNPFIEYLRAALEACTDGYSFESMFRMLKSGMTDFPRADIEQLENYALGTGLKGKGRWREKLIYHYRDEDPAEVPKLDALRAEICALIDPLSVALARRGGTVREKADALYSFCVRSGAERKLAEREQALRESGEGALAREYAQVYPYVIGFLDKLVAVLGDQPISMADFRALLEAGFAEARVAVIPPGSDRVVIGDVERTRLGEVKALLFLGVNEGLIPKTEASGGLLTECDRETLEKADIALKPTARQAAYIERFYLYTALTRPSARLYLSASRTGAKGESLSPAYLFESVRRLFGDPEVEDVSRSPRAERKRASIRRLTDVMQRLGERPLDGPEKELFLSYRFDPDYADFTERLLSAAVRRKPADQIGRAAARALYGTDLHCSATRLESFCACAFSHFLQYGLRLRQRPDYQFTGMDFGNLMHRSLELAGTRLIGKNLEGTEPGALSSLAADSLKQAVREVGESSVLYSTARDQYRIRKMQRLLDASLDAIGAQLGAGRFSVYAVEEDFRSREGLQSLAFSFPDGTSMTLTGRIDRIDTCDDGDVTYVKIVDYKTGGTVFDPSLVYYGLQLQLVMYMNAAMEILRKEGKHPQPGGLFYFRVQDPILPDHGETDEELAGVRLKKMTGSGVVSTDEAVLDALDRDLRAAGRSDVIPVSRTKKGAFGSRSAVLDDSGFQVLGRYAAFRVQKAGAAMMRGAAEMNPYAYGQRTACTWCPFRSACGFEQRIPGCTYRMLAKMDTKLAIAKMEETMTADESGKTPGEEKEDGNPVD